MTHSFSSHSPLHYIVNGYFAPAAPLSGREDDPLIKYQNRGLASD